MDKQTAPIDLTLCAREPIRVPGAIQPHGCLLAFDMATWTVSFASENSAAILSLDGSAAIVGQSIEHLFSSRLVHDMRNTLQASMMSGHVEMLSAVAVTDGVVTDVLVHASAEHAVIELMPIDKMAATTLPLSLVRSMMTRVKRAPSLERAFVVAANQIRAVTGFDRVMVYRFLDDGSGHVVGESTRAGLTPFLGLRYPASDIPPQARELYLQQAVRLIPDVFYEPSRLVSAGEAPTALDLSRATLRSVSPIHIEYLKNMGSAATMTISLIAANKLWGLIACHHQAPRFLPNATAEACEMFGQMFSMRIEVMEREREAAFVARARDAHERLITSMPPEQHLFDNIALYSDMLSEMIPCDGVGVWTGGVFSGVGSLPPVESMQEVIALLDDKDARRVFATHQLDEDVPSAAAYRDRVSGMLAIPFARKPRDYLFFFRKEVIQTVTWGGDPNKPVESTAHGTRIGPRKSFAAWREEVSGQSQPWLGAELHIAEGLRISLLDIILRRSDITEREQRNTHESQAILIAELNHRVKNILALIRSLVRQSQNGAVSVSSFTSDLDQRIRALSFAHDQMTLSGWTAAPLRRLLESEAKAWARSALDNIIFEGPNVMLESRAYQTLALVIHELMTNAAKYGSLSVLSGHVRVAWYLSEEGALTLEWMESDGPPVKAPSRRGFGTVVVEQTIPFELQGEAQIDYRPEGLRARFVIPSNSVSMGEDTEASQIAPVADRITLHGKRLLLVEDSMMIALDAQSALQDVGVTVDVAGTVPDAMRAIAVGRFDAVLLDINLSGETSFAVADRCRTREVPFVFATGYGEAVIVPDRFKGVPIVSKPYDENALSAALQVVIDVVA